MPRLIAGAELHQQVQHIIGMPLQLIIIGRLQSFIIFIISMQQLFIISMLMPAIGIILQVMLSPTSVHSIMHFIIGIIDMPPIAPIIGIIMPMAGWDMPIIDRLPHCIIIGMPQFIIICIISAVLRNIAMSMPAAGFMVHIMPSSAIWQVMVAIIIGMPIIGIIGMLALIGICICIAFIMVKVLFNSMIGCEVDAPILGPAWTGAR